MYPDHVFRDRYTGQNNDFGISAIVDSYLARNKLNAEFVRSYGKVKVYCGRRFSYDKGK
jgi:hypothetical protein